MAGTLLLQLHILLVDDHDQDLALIAADLLRNGCEPQIERVNTAAAMQHALTHQQWDVVIADNTLAAFSTLEALDLLQRSGQDRPFIVISDTAGEQHAVEAMRAGAHDYLMKDNLHRLAPAIEREMRDADVRMAQRQANAALQNSETRFAIIFHSGTIAMCISVEATSTIIDANASFLHMLGFSREELVGHSVDNLNLWADPAERERMHQLFYRQGFVHDFEFTFRTKSGDLHYGLASFEPLELSGEHCVLASVYDVTERKRQEDLRSQEEQFRLLFQHSPDAILLIDPHDPGGQWPIVDCNEVACSMNGYPREELIGMPIDMLNVERSDAMHRARYLEWLRDVKVHTDEDVHRRKDGTLVPIEFSTSLITVGERELILGIDRETTERKRIEELHASEQHFRVLFQQLPDSLVLIDPHHPSGTWTVVDCNEAACSMHGYTRKQLRGFAFNNLLLHERSAEEQARMLEQLRHNRAATGQSIQRHRDGTTFPTEYSASLITVGGRELVLKLDHDISERIKAERAQQAAVDYQRFQAQVLEQINDAVIATDLDFQIHGWNAAAEKIYGWCADQVIGKSIREVIPVVRYLDGSQPADAIHTLTSTGFWKGEVIHPHRDGSELIIEGSVQLIRDHELAPISVVAINRDITTRKQAEEALRTSEEYLRALVENGVDLITVLNPDGTIRYLSPSQDRVFGQTSRERTGRHIADMIYPEDRHLALDLLKQVLEESQHIVTSEIRVLHPNGSYRILDVTAVNMLAHPAVRGIVINAHDITDRKRMEQQLVHDALHDVLTGLPNRALFYDRMEKAQQRSWRMSGRQFAVLFLDLDRFKTINDNLGHSFGDQLLIEVGRRLESCLRLGDTVARLGGDEFAILLEELSDVSFATQIASKLCRAIEVPFLIAGQEIVTSASVGIAFSTSNNHRLDEMLRDADIAMYRAKRLGQGRHMLADPTLHIAIRERLQLEADLRQAIERGDLWLDYQPKVAIDGHAIIGVEALCRWRHPERGMIEPKEFIPIAEESGLIIPLGEWVLRTACSQLKRWHQQGLPQIFVAVNISALQFRRPDLAQTIATILDEVGLEPRFLALELTESILMEDAATARGVLGDLLATGIGHVAMDDFGTGYSSLSYLQRFPISTIKIDRSFVNEVTITSGGSAIAAAIIALARSLGLNTIAEGVETEAQRGWLELQGCDMFQGFLFSRPLPVDEIGRLLAASMQSPSSDLVEGTCPI